MQHLISRLGVRRKLCAMTAAALVSVALPAAADACTVSTTGGLPVFKLFGDLSKYVILPSGTFEGGTGGWSLKASSIVSGNEPYHLNAQPDAHSLSISSTGDALSPSLCVSSATPTFRFFAQQTNGGSGQLGVYLQWTDKYGASHRTSVASLRGLGSWFATPSLLLGASLPLWQPGSTLSVRLEFAPSIGSSWAIDDVFIDPYSK